MRSGGHRGAGQGLAGLSAAGPCWVVGIRVVGQKVALRILHWREVPPLLARAGKRGNGRGNRTLWTGLRERATGVWQQAAWTDRAAVWMWMVRGDRERADDASSTCKILTWLVTESVCKTLELTVLLQTPKASELGRRVTKGVLQGGSWLWLGSVEGLVVLSWKWAELCLFSPSVADLAVLG